MLLIDRYILRRFLVNFVTLFLLLFVFAATIDLILNLDDFVDATRAIGDEDGGTLASVGRFLYLVWNFQYPRLFQFYAYLHGLVAIGAMAFTLAQMHRYKELVAVMASGISLYRIALPFFLAVFGISFVQLINQEFMLPRVAPLLLRGHGDIGMEGVREFEVPLTVDSRGNLLQAAVFDPAENTLHRPTFLERDERGLTSLRITADRAVWDEQAEHWKLVNGRSMRPHRDEHREPVAVTQQPVEYYETDLDPRILTVRRHGEYAAMLSLAQIQRMLDSGGAVDVSALLRYRYTRFASVLVNLLVLALTLPCFLLREPANLLRQSLICAAVTLPSMLGAALGMMVDLPGIPPAAGVFLPVIILLFLVIVPWTGFRT